MSADPQSLGPYRIVRRVGAGGMGVVYEAVHTGLEKRVALKVLPRESVANRLERFLREARTAAALHHTNIVPVFDVGQVDGVPYFAMQFIDGRPLDAAVRASSHEPEVTKSVAATPDATTDHVPTEPATRSDASPVRRGPRTVVAQILQAAEGLAYAHGRGVVHRDIKPANLLVDADGVVWVADFGLAFRAADPTMTADGAVIGTPRYMSPEQARGEKTDARTDVFSLGVTLYELLTGTPAFPGDTVVEVLNKVMSHTPPPPRSVDRRISADLETVVVKAMAKRRDDRYATGREFADDLRRYLNGEPVRARRIGPVGTAWRWSKRNPAVAALLAAVLLVFAVGAGSSTYYANQADRRAWDARVNELKALDKEGEANGQKRKAEDAARYGQRLLYAARMNLASVALHEGRYGRVSEYLRETLPGPGSEDLRGWEWHYLFRQVHGADRVTPTKARLTAVDGIRLTPNRLVSVMYDGEKLRCERYDPITGEFVSASEGELTGMMHGALTVTNDGRRVLQRTAHDVVVWDAEAGKEVARFPRTGNGVEAALSPDGRYFARPADEPFDPTAPLKKTAWAEVLDLATGKRVFAATGDAPFGAWKGLRLRYSSDGRWLGGMDERGRLVVWEPGVGAVRYDSGIPDPSLHQLRLELDFLRAGRFGSGLHAPPPPKDEVPVWAIGPSGVLAVTDSTFRSVVLRPLAGKTATHTAGPFRRPVRQMKFDDTGRWLAAAAYEDLHLIDTTGRVPTRCFRSAALGQFAVTFSADGTKLQAFGWERGGGGQVREWDITRPAYRLPGEALAGVLSPVGGAAVVVSNGVGVVDLQNGKLAPFAGPPTTGDAPPAWSADGARVAVAMEAAVAVFDAATGKPLRQFDSKFADPVAVQFSACGRFVLAASREASAAWDAESGREVFRHTAPNAQAAFLPNPTRLAVASAAGMGVTLAVRDIDAGTVRTSDPLAGELDDEPIAVDPAGRWAAFLYRAAGGQVTRVVVFDTTAARPEVAASFPVPAGRSAASHLVSFGGGWLAVTDDRRTQLYSLPHFHHGPLLVGDDRASALHFTPDGRRVLVRYAVGGDQHLKVWDTTTGEEVLTVPLGGEIPMLLAYPAPHFGGDRYTFPRRGPKDELEYDALDGTPVPDALARERLGIK